MGEGAAPWPQEIRLAMTMVGGASLAVWMSGVATETSALLHASRSPEDGGGYRKLLDLLRAKVRLDVLTGTSAGGVGAAGLGLAEAFRSSPAPLRDVLLADGSLTNLIRDPKEAQPRSLLDGDRFLGDLDGAFRTIVGGGTTATEPPDVTLLLPGTMIDGETVRYDDALGNLIRDTEHRMLFRFTGPLWNGGVTAPLALAARSTASFPGAFELSRLPVGPAVADRLHPDMTAYTELTRSHWLTDGGVLVNKPLRPALREIFELSSSSDVRRLLLYVVPTVEAEAAAVPVNPANPPLLGAALAKVVSTVINQTISADLEELTAHNDAVVATRDTRVSLAALGLRGGRLVDDRIMAAYLERRVAEDAAELVRTATRYYALSTEDSKDPGWAKGMSTELRAVAAEGLRNGMPAKAPGAVCHVEDLAAFRTTALDDSVATGLQLVNAAFHLCPDEQQAKTLNGVRARLHAARGKAARGIRITPWIAKHEPPAAGVSAADWIAQLAHEWAQLGKSDALREAWPMVTGALSDAAPVLRELARDPLATAAVLKVSGQEPVPAEAPGPELGTEVAGLVAEAVDTVTTLVGWFGLAGDNADGGGIDGNPGNPDSPDNPGSSAGSDGAGSGDSPGTSDGPGTTASTDNRKLMSRLILLHVATRGLLAQPPSVDQRVDLVQVSADSRTLLDFGRQRGWDKLTGLQADYFGAFYKASWRANDWLWGRVDAVGWLVQCLLDPHRLRVLRNVVGPEAFRTEVREAFTAVGWQLPSAADNVPAADVASLVAQLGEELAFLGLDAQLGEVAFSDDLPTSLPVTAMVLARGRQLEIAREELPVVAQRAAEDAKEGNGKPSEPFRKIMTTPPADAAATQRAFQACQVSAERFEGERGTVLLTKTLVKAGATGLNAAAGATRVPTSLQPAAKVAQATGRSAWWVTQGATKLGRPWNLVAAAVTAVAGLVLGGNGGQVLQWVGPPVAAGAIVFLLVSLLTLKRTWRMVLTLLCVLVVAALLFAAFLPPLAQPLFGWLGAVVAGWRRGEAPVWWLLVVLLLVLPAFWTPLAALRRRTRRADHTRSSRSTPNAQPRADRRELTHRS
ncbi:patatin-like protein [Amycolatopsis rhabdoformis]|uniref:Patatin-like protein n=1 Tax=Amycolatopsis rhabdoformis TaxID=1448059 RepID=A0ABZ1I0J2_9PSEU|nr:patatin-like protein [Amycolatopsis rhabdoformis]WSE27624.1 patatin-like protein [Amycolatopsis rhabdoformis]